MKWSDFLPRINLTGGNTQNLFAIRHFTEYVYRKMTNPQGIVPVAPPQDP